MSDEMSRAGAYWNRESEANRQAATESRYAFVRWLERYGLVGLARQIAHMTLDAMLDFIFGRRR